MKSVLSITTGLRLLFAGVMVVLFSTGCSKQEDDCSPPANSGTQATTRMSAGGDENAIKDEKPAGMSYRGAELGDGDTDGDGISDDGDDEADGEGNKKGRTQH